MNHYYQNFVIYISKELCFSEEFVHFKISPTWLADPSDILGCWNQASVVAP